MRSKIYLLIIAGVALIPMGCTKYVEGINVDPNNPADAPIEAVLNAAFTGTILTYEGEQARLGALWSRQFTGADRQYSGFENYIITAGDFNWDRNYLIAKNADIVIEKAAATNNQLAAAIARILKAHTIGMTASLWGDIPNTQALQFPTVDDPQFDEQAAVYADVLHLLDEAIDELSTEPEDAAVAGKDFYFQGDALAWQRVAHTLKARFLLHTGDYASALNEAAEGILQSSDDWLIPHAGGSYLQDLNIYNSFGTQDREGYMTASNAVLPTWLDPAAAAYRGNSKTDETDRFDFLFTGTAGNYDLNYEGMWAETAVFPLATAVETHLIMAESAWRQGSMAQALEELNAARNILAGQFPGGRYDSYVLADFAPGGMAAITGKSADEALLYEILEEKYVSLVGEAEVFNDVRRTDNLLQLPPTSGSNLPQRFLIPQTEIDANSQVPNPIPGIFEPTALNR